jgi:hypothetical protein
MPNVDFSTRLLNMAALDSYKQLCRIDREKITRSFCELPETQKPITFRHVDFNDINNFFEALNSSVKRALVEHYKVDDLKILADSNDNRVGSDLIIEIETKGEVIKKRIEVKFGSETKRNIGNNTMDKVFPCSNNPLFFSQLFKEITQKQRNFVLKTKGDFDLYYANLEKLLKIASLSIINQLNEGRLSVDSTIMKDLLSSTGAIGRIDQVRDIETIRIDYNKVPIKIVKMLSNPNLSGQWKFEKIGMAPSATRVEIKAANEFVEAKFLLNWKNNFHINGKEYAAKLGLGITSWNVWIYS